MNASASRSTRQLVGRARLLGRVWAEVDVGGALMSLRLPDLDAHHPEPPTDAEPGLPAELQAALDRYVAGEEESFARVVLAPPCTAFAAEVRRALCAIGWGRVCTYGQVAAALGRPGGARAVGRACATNPVPVVVPCHRVVGAAGAGGFGLGLDAKRTLLGIEGYDLQSLLRR